MILYFKILAFLFILTSTFVSSDDPYIPCQSWIGFLYDDSNSLLNSNYKTQMSFISSVLGAINYPDRIFIQGAVTEVSAWESHQTILQIQEEINNIQQTDISYLLLRQLANLVTDIPTTESENWPIGVLVFISDTSPDALRNAMRFMPQLSNVQLTFVLLGPNVDETKLTNFTSNFIYWKDLSKPQPDNWDTVATSAFGCNGIVTTQLPSTVSTAATSTSTFLPSTSTSTIASSTATTSSPTTSESSTLSSTITSSPSATSTSTIPSSTASSTTSLPSVYPRTADIVFILDDSNCDINSNIETQKNTILNVLNNYTMASDGVRVANPRSIGSAGFQYVFLANLNAFINTYLINCHHPRDPNFTIDKALRSSMSFAYKYTRQTSEALIFVVFTINNGTSVQFGDDGSAMNAAVAYRSKCMSPGNVEIIQINPELGNYFFKYDDPNIYDKFLNAVMAAGIYDKSAVPESDCIDPIHSYLRH